MAQYWRHLFWKWEGSFNCLKLSPSHRSNFKIQNVYIYSNWPNARDKQESHTILSLRQETKNKIWQCLVHVRYRISRPIRRTFFPEKCYLNSTCVLCAEGKYYSQTYKYPYIYYMKKVAHRVKTTMKMILVAVTTIFWVSMMNKLYYGC
jgi:hypothetical protein